MKGLIQKGCGLAVAVGLGVALLGHQPTPL